MFDFVIHQIAPTTHLERVLSGGRSFRLAGHAYGFEGGSKSTWIEKVIGSIPFCPSTCACFKIAAVKVKTHVVSSPNHIISRKRRHVDARQKQERI
ncbi:hypothetical protein MLD38_040177 [Melastoma candidum]|uniref:Uncharacterized protein n=1 Tax=Melastoma candidum TaxID=119954 RepID=A0ACB9L5M2_9MYRT|nr:hypothetical protein MLD38_040177 [Melastoma candidum]